MQVRRVAADNEALRERIARSRADLETLTDLAGWGGVGRRRTGRPLSFNREAARIVNGLSRSGQPPPSLLEALKCRLPDGREFALAELPSASPPGNATTMRVEEMVLSIPDGGEMRTLVGATPIHGGGGDVEWVVVTLQDRAPIEKLDRLRVELLDMVSRERGLR